VVAGGAGKSGECGVFRNLDTVARDVRAGKRLSAEPADCFACSDRDAAELRG